MEIFAVSKSVRIAPRKVRLVADAIRKMAISDALVALENADQRAAVALLKTLKSAVANAKNRKLDENILEIKMVDVMDAAFYKRFRPSTRGRVHPYKRRGSHIKIVLTDNKAQSQPEVPNIKATKTKAQDLKSKKEENGTKS